MAAASILTVAISVVNKIFGYVREAVIAGYFGTSAVFDIFILAFTIPEIVTSIIMMALPSALIPSLREKDPLSSENNTRYFWHGVIIFTPIFALLSLAILIFREELFAFLAADYSPDGRSIGPRLLAISSAIVFFRGMESYFRSWLFEKRHFIVPYTSNLVLDAVILGAIFIFFGSSGIDSLAYGWLIASVALFAYNFVFAVIVVRPSVKIDFHWSWGGKILKLMAAVSLIELISMSFPVVDRFVAARTLGPGQISALRYAMTLVAIPVLVFIVSFGTASFPWISDYSIQSETDKLKKLYRESIGLIIFVMTLISFGVAVFSGDIIRVAFNRGAFNETSILLTSSPLTIYALGIVFYSIYIFQMRFYFAKMDLFRLGTLLGIMLMIKIAASYLLVGPLGHNGLALSTSITWLVGFGLMTYDLGRKLNIAFADLINYSIIRQVSIAAMIGVYWFIMARFWSGIGQSFVTGLLFLASMAISGILLYLVSSALAKSPELSRISKYIPGRLKPTRWLK